MDGLPTWTNTKALLDANDALLDDCGEIIGFVCQCHTIKQDVSRSVM